jgi:hypothetical protein
MIPAMKIHAALFLALLMALPAVAVSAQTVEQDGRNDEYSMKTEAAEQVFDQYYESIEAKQLCSGATATEMVTVSPDISYGAGRLLNLRRHSEAAMDSLVNREGCNGQKVKKSLAFFDERLANAHPVSAALPGPRDTAAAIQLDAMPSHGSDRSVTAAPVSLTPAEASQPDVPPPGMR